MIHFNVSLFLTIIGFITISVVTKYFLSSLLLSAGSILLLGVGKEWFDLIIQGQSWSETLIDMKFNLLGIGVVILMGLIIYISRRLRRSYE